MCTFTYFVECCISFLTFRSFCVRSLLQRNWNRFINQTIESNLLGIFRQRAKSHSEIHCFLRDFQFQKEFPLWFSFKYFQYGPHTVKLSIEISTSTKCSINSSSKKKRQRYWLVHKVKCAKLEGIADKTVLTFSYFDCTRYQSTEQENWLNWHWHRVYVSISFSQTFFPQLQWEKTVELTKSVHPNTTTAITIFTSAMQSKTSEANEAKQKRKRTFAPLNYKLERLCLFRRHCDMHVYGWVYW